MVIFHSYVSLPEGIKAAVIHKLVCEAMRVAPSGVKKKHKLYPLVI